MSNLPEKDLLCPFRVLTEVHEPVLIGEGGFTTQSFRPCLYDRCAAYKDGWCLRMEKTAPEEPVGDLEDHCPVCGAEIEYGGDQEIVDNGTVVSFSCPKCGAHGKAGYDLVFDAYYDVQKGDEADADH